MTQTLTDYAKQKREESAGKKVPSAIRKRWQERVVAQGLDQMGETGAYQYLERYGRGIAAPKCIDLARQAEAEGCADMARGFWRKAYVLENGCEPPAEDGDTAASASHVLLTAPASAKLPVVDGLPEHLQIGRLVTMQPIDAPQGREAYVADDSYWGQAKKDGWRMPTTATPGGVYYQSRELNLQGPPALEIDEALKAAAEHFGIFILDTERVYYDVNGREHKTAGDAATVNVNDGQPDVQPQVRLAIFKALFADGRDLTTEPESERIAVGERIGAWLVAREPSFFEVLDTARTRKEKEDLVAKQQKEGREGEVWVQHRCLYTGGKTNGARPPILRTKYRIPLCAVVLDLTPTTAENRAFGAAEVGVYRDGTMFSLGRVGTGFTREQMKELLARHQASPGQVVIAIETQRFTVNHQLVHGTFEDFSDTPPAECVWNPEC